MNRAAKHPTAAQEKCAAVIVRNKRVLVARKASTDIFISPGGKIEPGETHEDCLRRELAEELGANLLSCEFFGTYSNASALEAGTVTIHVYRTEVSEPLEPRSEIVELTWVGGRKTSPDVKIGSVFADCVIPKLVAEGIVDA